MNYALSLGLSWLRVTLSPIYPHVFEYSAPICGCASGRAVERQICHLDPPPIPWQRKKPDRVSLLGTGLLCQ